MVAVVIWLWLQSANWRILARFPVALATCGASEVARWLLGIRRVLQRVLANWQPVTWHRVHAGSICPWCEEPNDDRTYHDEWSRCINPATGEEREL